MNPITECRQVYLKHIDALKVPEHIKVQMREIIFAQFSIMSKTISSIELIYLRETQNGEDEEDPDKGGFLDYGQL